MSLQSIINSSNQIEINRRKMVGIQFTRNQLPRVLETPTYNPWRFNVTLPNSMRYSEARQVLEAIDTLDRTDPETVNFTNIPWLLAYQGTVSQSQLNHVTFNSFSGNQLVLNVSGVSANSTDVLLEKGDFLQIQGYPYPFTSTTRVLRGSYSTVTVTTHRPNIFNTQPANGTYINFGNQVSFNLFCPNMPTYKLIPGGAIVQNGQVVNNALIQWSDTFQLYEYIVNI